MAGKPGRSGRRPKRETFGALYEATERDLHGLLPEVGHALRELVVGVWMQEDTRDGVRIYRQAPNVQAIQLLLNRTMGETSKKVELSGDLNVWVAMQRELLTAIAQDAG